MKETFTPTDSCRYFIHELKPSPENNEMFKPYFDLHKLSSHRSQFRPCNTREKLHPKHLLIFVNCFPGFLPREIMNTRIL